jgi:hypothetical protein
MDQPQVAKVLVDRARHFITVSSENLFVVARIV